MLTISEQQAAFYTQNGFLELEGVFSSSECVELRSTIQETLRKRAGTEFVRGRDLWRDSALLKNTLLSKKFKNIVFAACRKPAVRLAMDQWFPPGFALKTPEKMEKLFSIQGLVCTLFIQCDDRQIHASPSSPLGLSPFPKHQGNLLLMKPSLLLNWPPVTPEMGLYCVSFCMPTSVYVQNSADEAGISLRKLDYGYGDHLRNDTHPLVLP